MQIPTQAAVFKRELMSRMYHPVIYFSARFLSNFFFDVTAPIIMLLITYYFLGVNETTNNILILVALVVLLGLLGNASGYICALLIDDDMTARNLLVMIQITWICGMGTMVNLNTNPFTKALQYVSPLRFAAEIAFRALADGKNITYTYQGVTYEIYDAENSILDTLHYDFGYKTCFYGLVGYVALYVLAGIVAIWARNWKFL